MAANDSFLNIDKIAQDVTKSLFSQVNIDSRTNSTLFKDLLTKSIQEAMAVTTVAPQSTSTSANTELVKSTTTTETAASMPSLFDSAQAYVPATVSALTLTNETNGTVESTTAISTSADSFSPWTAGKPGSLKELMDFMSSRNMAMDSRQAVDFLYGSVGANDDLRDFDLILNAEDPIAANNQALGQLFSNAEARTNPGYTKRGANELIASAGNLLVRDAGNGSQLLAAQAANGMPLRDIYNSPNGIEGGLSRYGITDADIQTILDDEKVTADIKATISPYLGHGYTVGSTNYLLSITLPSFAVTGVFDQYGANDPDNFKKSTS